MSVSFEEAAFGTKKDIKITRNEDCPECGGSGAEKGTERTTCPNCNGTGQIRKVTNTVFGQVSNVTTCPNCGGKGTIVKTPCKKCSGKGNVRKDVTISVDIPAGVDNDSVISLRGQGEAGLNGGPSGDVYIIIQVKPHKIFSRNGSDLILEIPVTYPQAVLGADLVIPTLTEKISYKVPPGTQHGTTFRLKGKGIKVVNSNNRYGDLYVRVLIEIPKKINNEQRKLLQQLEEAYNTGEHEQKKNFMENVKDLFKKDGKDSKEEKDRDAKDGKDGKEKESRAKVKKDKDKDK